MINPEVQRILESTKSRYSLVIGVAKRARDIAVDAENKSEILIEKPVKLAVGDFIDGKCKIIEIDTE